MVHFCSHISLHNNKIINLETNILQGQNQTLQPDCLYCSEVRTIQETRGTELEKTEM